VLEGEGLEALAKLAAQAAHIPPESRGRLGPAIAALRALHGRLDAPVPLPSETDAR
jgi:hypothetical protein